ncbi:beta-1,3-glucanase family protein [Kitasatospora aureofaciens]|uniref:beta-1,3-glucanase family protein n=1 Tax=Kitasatospora aureofaciens TaxID=1894 RepID=UPI001C4911C8|nr:beta-1,3-glucanase family protein [Kitasatospora aureofaciens]MBV6695515.1 carbohydrate-binding protein [Kitasatospora aureofaciens]
MISRRTLLTTAGTATAALLGAPLLVPALDPVATAAGPSLPLTLRNTSGSNTVYAYLTGSDSSNRPGFVGPDGAFQPLANPSSNLTPVPDYSIPLGASGGAGVTLNLTQYVIGGRVWFSTGKKIQFFVNPAVGGGQPGLVEPGFSTSDPNWLTDWTFCEFTWNAANLYANISYVDLVAAPVSMASTGAAGNQAVSPLPAGALTAVADGLVAQHAVDGAPWDQLVVKDGGGTVLRVLAPTHSPVSFGTYFGPYVDQVWSRLQSTPLTVDTQNPAFGSFSGTVSNGVLTFTGLNTDGVAFTKPSTADIFSCASGPLYNSGGDARGAVAARLSAALNRSTLLLAGGAQQPGGVTAGQYYQNAITNHYARLVHANASTGYAFPYDDVGPTGSAPVDGHLQDPAPTSWTVTFGGGPGGGGGGGSTVSAYGTVQAASFSSHNGTQTEACSDTGGGQDVGWIHAGCWLGYTGLDFGSSSPRRFLARLASGAAAGISGGIEVRLGSPTGTKLAEIDLANTGGWQSWQTVPINLSGSVTGVHDVYLTFIGSTSDFVNLHWFTFSAT